VTNRVEEGSAAGRRPPIPLLAPLGLLCTLGVLPACSAAPSTPAGVAASTTTTTTAPTPTTTRVTLPEQNPAEIAACTADVQSVRAALEAFMAERGAYPAPAAAWSAATYAANYAPLTSGSVGGPFLPSAPTTRSYVIEYDSAGHVWVAPPGSYGPYDGGQDFALQPDICDAAVG
jgi:hypothetical protein